MDHSTIDSRCPDGSGHPAEAGSFRSRRALGAAMALIAALTVAVQATEARAQADDEGESVLQVERIELTLYGGSVWGDVFLDLPVPLDELTNDTANDQILDFAGEAPDPPVEAPFKEIELGFMIGGQASFFVNPNFAMTLYGEWGQSEAVFTAQPRRVIERVGPGGQIQTIVELDPRTEIDRATMTSFAGGARIAYHLGNERRTSRRPYVTLGFGGILNQFPDTDDNGALFFTAGAGLSFGISGPWRAFVGASMRLYTWETDEVALDPTLVFPSINAGITYRYIVPEDTEEGAEE